MGRITVEEYADFVREDQQRAYRLAYGYLRSREDALDAVQEAVASGLERLDSLREPQRLRTWFTRILVNECLDMLRRRKRRGGDASLDADPGLMPALPDGAERSTDSWKAPSTMASPVSLTKSPSVSRPKAEVTWPSAST